MLIIDAGPLIAASSRRDRDHERCATLLSESPALLVVPALVVTEVAYHLGTRLGPRAERAFAASIRAGELDVEPVEQVDWVRIEDLMAEYEDLELGLVDASVVAACERLQATRLATLDRRHFSVVRPRHCAALELLPD